MKWLPWKRDGTKFPAEITVSNYDLKGETFRLLILRNIADRKRAEELAQMLKHSIDVHYDGAYWMDSDGRFIYVNDAACKALGYEHEDSSERRSSTSTPLQLRRP